MWTFTCIAFWSLIGGAEPDATRPDAFIGPDADLDMLVFPAPEAAENRRPDVDIRRYLRPDASILDARSDLDRSLHETLKRRGELETLLARVTQDLAWREAAFATATDKLLDVRLDVTDHLTTLEKTRRLGTLTALISREPRLDWAGLMRHAGFLHWVELKVIARVTAWSAIRALWLAFDIDLQRRQRNHRHLERAIAVLTQQGEWDRVEQEALKKAVVEQAEFYAAWARDMEKVDEELKRFIRERLAEVGSRPRLYIEDNRNRVTLPLRNGVVAGGYGSRTHLGVKATSRGTEFVPDPEPPRSVDPRAVRSIYWGYVLWTGWFKGLGQVVILDHTQGYTSVYGYLSEIRVAIGAKVPTATTLGLIGDTESFFGTRLHFEMRLEGQAQNPMPWFF